MRVDDIVCQVIDSVLHAAFLFPMRCSFQSLAKVTTVSRSDTLSEIKEYCSGTIPLLPAEMKQKFVSQKSTSKSMQIMRAAVMVFNVLDLTASSWTIMLMRCAVKVAQDRYLKAIAGLEGDDVIEVFTNYAKGDTILELEKLRDKLKEYFSELRCFMEKSYSVSETELTEAEVECENQFREAANRSASLLMQLNSCVPILNVLNTTLRRHFEEAWKSECEEDGGTISERCFGNTKGLLFSEKALSFSPISVFGDVRFLQSVASNICNVTKRTGEVQVSVLVASEDICSTIAENNVASLKSVGYISERTASSTKTDSTSTPGQKGPGPSMKVKYIRNSHYQMDVYCLWSSIVECDRILEADVLSYDYASTSRIGLHLSDGWYENLSNSMLVPYLIQSAVSVPDSEKIQSALSYKLSRHIGKRS